MSPREVIATSAFTATVLAISLVSFLPGLAGSSLEGDAFSASQEFQWEAPANYTGDLAIGFHIEVDDPAFCWVNTTASGVADVEDPIGLWVSGAPPGISGGDGAHSGWSPTAQVHVRDAIDSRDPVRWRHRWTAGPFTGWRVDDAFNVTVAGFGLEDWRDTEWDSPSPFTVSVVCDEPYTLSKAGSRSGVAFTQETLRNGTGATAPAPAIEPHIGHMGSVGISMGDGFERRFANEQVRFQAYESSRGETVGNLTLRHPDGTYRWSSGIADEHEGGSFGLQGGPGSYELTMNLATWNDWPTPYGILIGLDSVDTLDEVL